MPRLLPSTVGKRCIRGFRFPAHLQVLEQHCLRLIDDPLCNRLLVRMPVRHGKSWFCSHAFATWHLLTRPSRQVILATYGKEFSAEWTGKIQGTITDYGRRLTGVALGPIRRKDHTTFLNLAKGGVRCGALRTASPGSKIAGKGAHLIIADDLVSDWREAASPARRRSLTTWVDSELFSRLEPDGKVLAVMSDRHPDDQSARWQAQNAELSPRLRWHVLRMPAIGDDGAALWPERWPLETLLEKKRGYELDGLSYLWDCLWMQDPRGDSTMIEWPDHYFVAIGYDELPPDLPVRLRVLSLDPSKGSGDKTGDYSGWSDVTLDASPRGVLWTYPHVRLLSTEQVEDYTVELLARTRYDAVVIECNGFQELIADNILRKCQAKGIPCPLWKRTSTEDKEVRIRLGLGPLLAQQRIRLCARSPSYRLALAQMREFPTGSHDDFPDSLNLACDLIGHLLGGRRNDSPMVYVA